MHGGQARPAGLESCQSLAECGVTAGEGDLVAAFGGFDGDQCALESLVEAHGTRRIVAVAHEDCAWYKARKIGPFKIDMRERQLSDLRRAAALLRRTFRDVEVLTYFARLARSSPERVIFDQIP